MRTAMAMMALAGAAMLLGGCTRVEHVEMEPTAYRAYEGGELKVFHAIEMDTDKAGAVEKGRASFLSDHEVDVNDFEGATNMLKTLPEDRLLVGMVEPRMLDRRTEPNPAAAPSLTEKVRRLANSAGSDHAKWVLSISPAVIGVDASMEAPRYPDGRPQIVKSRLPVDCWMVGDKDLDRKIVRVIREPLSAQPDPSAKESTSGEIIPIPQNRTIKELFANPPWIAAGGHPTTLPATRVLPGGGSTTP